MWNDQEFLRNKWAFNDIYALLIILHPGRMYLHELNMKQTCTVEILTWGHRLLCVSQSLNSRTLPDYNQCSAQEVRTRWRNCSPSAIPHSEFWSQYLNITCAASWLANDSVNIQLQYYLRVWCTNFSFSLVIADRVLPGSEPSLLEKSWSWAINEFIQFLFLNI